jgi:hypothetical protein
MTRAQLLDAHRVFYNDALARKWSAMFKTPTGAMWDKMIPAMSTSSTSFAHALGEWGVRVFGMETAAVMPMTAMRIAFTRGAARQYGGEFLYYHAPNFGDAATVFTKQMNYGIVMDTSFPRRPSLSSVGPMPSVPRTRPESRRAACSSR